MNHRLHAILVVAEMTALIGMLIHRTAHRFYNSFVDCLHHAVAQKVEDIRDIIVKFFLGQQVFDDAGVGGCG